MKRMMPLDRLMERKYGKPVAGVDEVGMAPLAGPICSCALVIREGSERQITVTDEIDDSKKLTRLQRERLSLMIKANATWGLGWVDVFEMDRIRNLNKAGELARWRAVEELCTKMGARPRSLISDHFHVEAGMPCMHPSKADQKSFVVACASIVAKVSRDNLMMAFHTQYSGYGWDKNCGYPTAQHWAAIRAYGVTPVHRRYIVDGILNKGGWSSLKTGQLNAFNPVRGGLLRG